LDVFTECGTISISPPKITEFSSNVSPDFSVKVLGDAFLSRRLAAEPGSRQRNTRRKRKRFMTCFHAVHPHDQLTVDYPVTT
jgi:hypothetical protein